MRLLDESFLSSWFLILLGASFFISSPAMDVTNIHHSARSVMRSREIDIRQIRDERWSRRFGELINNEVCI